jgi:serine/threonine protein kinase
MTIDSSCSNEEIVSKSIADETTDAVQLTDVALHMIDPCLMEVADPCLTNLTNFHSCTKWDPICHANFTLVNKVKDGINGSIFKYRWRRSQRYEQVAVKKLRQNTVRPDPNLETNERAIHFSKSWNVRNPEDALTEIGVLSLLSKQEDLPEYVLKMHGVFSDPEHKLTWLVTEYADGGELFDVACSGGTSQGQLRIYMSQLLEAVAFLHRHHIGHRDISLENVLLKDGVCKLMDFGMAVCTRSACGTPLRYFRKVGKYFYRAPECYVPARPSVSVLAPSDIAPGNVVMVETNGFLCEVRLPESAKPNERCVADVWGYAVEPADMFALGVCMFILAFQVPPWENALPSNQYFSFVREKGLEAMLKLWKKSCLCPEAMLLMESLLHIDPAKRQSAKCCLHTSWLADSRSSMDRAGGA